MRRFITLLAMITLLLPLSGCGQSPRTSGDTAEDQSADPLAASEALEADSAPATDGASAEAAEKQ